MIALNAMDLRPLMEKYGVTAVLDQYHSGLEYTFLWAVETKEPHRLEEFSIELGIARWNDLKYESNSNHISRKAAKPAKKILCVSAALREIKRIFTSRQSET